MATLLFVKKRKKFMKIGEHAKIKIPDPGKWLQVP